MKWKQKVSVSKEFCYFNNRVTRSDLHKEHTASSTSLPMCTCCQHLFIKKNIWTFYEKNYDTENSVVKHFMSRRQILPNIVEYVCKSCHRALSSEKTWLPKHLNSANGTLSSVYVHPLFKCCVCDAEHNAKQTCDFDIDNYNQDNPLLKCMFGKNYSGASSKEICKQCHAKLIRHSLVTCSLCKKNIKHYNPLILKNTKQLKINQHMGKEWVCKPCNSTLVNEIKCVSCDKKCPKHKIIKYCQSKYDMTDNLVQTLCGAVNGSDFICSDCDIKLTATNVCTCCHEKKFNLYRMTVFDTEKCDFTDYIVS